MSTSAAKRHCHLYTICTNGVVPGPGPVHGTRWRALWSGAATELPCKLSFLVSPPSSRLFLICYSTNPPWGTLSFAQPSDVVQNSPDPRLWFYMLWTTCAVQNSPHPLARHDIPTTSCVLRHLPPPLHAPSGSTIPLLPHLALNSAPFPRITIFPALTVICQIPSSHPRSVTCAQLPGMAQQSSYRHKESKISPTVLRSAKYNRIPQYGAAFHSVHSPHRETKEERRHISICI